MNYWDSVGRWINALLLFIVGIIGFDTLFRMLQAQETNIIVGVVRLLSTVVLVPFRGMFSEQDYLLTAAMGVLGYAVLVGIALTVVRSIQATQAPRRPYSRPPQQESARPVSAPPATTTPQRGTQRVRPQRTASQRPADRSEPQRTAPQRVDAQRTASQRVAADGTDGQAAPRPRRQPSARATATPRPRPESGYHNGRTSKPKSDETPARPPADAEKADESATTPASARAARRTTGETSSPKTKRVSGDGSDDA